MDELKQQLIELNTLADELYDYVERSGLRVTRRRLLILETLLFIDTNMNAVFRLVANEPQYLDGAEMMLRSMYDLMTNVDWVLKARTNVRLWRWLRDDRKTLHRQLNALVDLKTAHPELITTDDPLSTWQNALTKTTRELTNFSGKAGVNVSTGELSLFDKAKTFSPKAEQLYRTLFWLFSTKTHASPTGLHGLITLHPLRLRRRDGSPTPSEERDAIMLLRTGLTWYAAAIVRAAQYLHTPQLDDARLLYKSHINRGQT